MVRLMLTLTPVVCLTAAMTISKMFGTYLDPILPADSKTAANGTTASSVEDESDGVPEAPLATPLATPVKSKKKTAVGQSSTDGYSAPLASAATSSKAGIHGMDLRFILVGVFTSILGIFVLHCTWVTSTAYSSPSVVLASRAPDGSQNIIDDFREAYYWLRRNTAEDAKVMSWWGMLALRWLWLNQALTASFHADYGYQVEGEERYLCTSDVADNSMRLSRSLALQTGRLLSTITPGTTLSASHRQCHVATR